MNKEQIYLFCDVEMSTSIMMSKMMEVVEKYQMPLMITALPIARAQEVVEAEKPVTILLRPQARFLLEKTKKQFAPQRVPVAAITPEIYGMMGGEKAPKEALRLIKQNEK